MYFATAIQLGWTAKPRYKDGELYIDFHRKRLAGGRLFFSLQNERWEDWQSRQRDRVIREDAIDPEGICAEG